MPQEAPAKPVRLEALAVIVLVSGCLTFGEHDAPAEQGNVPPGFSDLGVLGPENCDHGVLVPGRHLWWVAPCADQVQLWNIDPATQPVRSASAPYAAGPNGRFIVFAAVETADEVVAFATHQQSGFWSCGGNANVVGDCIWKTFETGWLRFSTSTPEKPVRWTPLDCEGREPAAVTFLDDTAYAFGGSTSFGPDRARQVAKSIAVEIGEPTCDVRSETGNDLPAFAYAHRGRLVFVQSDVVLYDPDTWTLTRTRTFIPGGQYGSRIVFVDGDDAYVTGANDARFPPDMLYGYNATSDTLILHIEHRAPPNATWLAAAPDPFEGMFFALVGQENGRPRLYRFMPPIPDGDNGRPELDVTVSVDRLVATFDFSASRDPDGDRLGFFVKPGDDNRDAFETGGDNPKITHEYRAPGTYRAVVFVMDEAGATSSQVRQVNIS